MEALINTTINEQHLSKTAYVYVRQSTLAQVRHHQESTERQYALRAKALDTGSSEPSVQILDRDLGKSAARYATGGFQDLVAEVSMGQVVRFLRWRFRDWRVEFGLASIAGAVCTDRYAGDRRRWFYNPADFNDGLLLGLKGTMAQAELHLFAGASLVASSIKKERRTAFPASGRALL